MNLLFVSSLFVFTLWTTPIDADLQANCIIKQTCSACIRTLGCVWCDIPLNPFAVKRNESVSKCISKGLQNNNWCSSTHVIDLKTSSTVIENNELNAGTDGKEAVQIQPQRIKLTMREGDEKTINFVYQQAQDYPIDLYFLLDLSSSMRDDKEKLSSLGDSFAEVMKNMTNNFRLGFGSFVDKPDLPFVSTHPERLAKPCDNCVAAYSFMNTMPLTKDTALFSKEVKSAKVSGNLDFPEGGFDALMQAMVCKDEIKWRSKARKLIVLCTDASFHSAGDGKLAGIVEPNDELCHLNEAGNYTHALLMDYPSIGQLDKQAKENNINIIFAVVKQQVNVYKALVDNIHGALYATLENDSSNIVSLVKGVYEKIVDSIEFTDNSPSFVDIQYYSKCIGRKVEKTNKCDDLRRRPKLEFNAVIKALSCPENKKDWKQTIEIRPGSLDERLIIDLEILCQCPCDDPGHSTFGTNSTKCSSHGHLQCGVCNCESGRYGHFCECDDSKTSMNNTEVCTMPGSDKICSGQGFCKCGMCDCMKRPNPEEIIHGKYCECDNFSCERNRDLLCSGPENGNCQCGKCVCHSGWSGPACNCRERNETCTNQGDKEVCSGKGTCECGVCQCNMVNNVRYSGKYCEECLHCPSNKCDELRHCVECEVHSSGKYNRIECTQKCNNHKIVSVEKLDAPKEEEGVDEKLCKVPDDGYCNVLFKYKYDEEKKLIVTAQKTKDCTEKEDLIAIICGVVGGTFLGGIVLLLVWKISTTMHDRREYAKFEQEQKAAKFDRGDNPLYKPSTSTFKNPAFGGDL